MRGDSFAFGADAAFLVPADEIVRRDHFRNNEAGAELLGDAAHPDVTHARHRREKSPPGEVQIVDGQRPAGPCAYRRGSSNHAFILANFRTAAKAFRGQIDAASETVEKVCG